MVRLVLSIQLLCRAPEITGSAFMCPPILYLIFNRPDLIEQSFAPIRNARPAQLFIAADGPRPEDRDQRAEVGRRMSADGGSTFAKATADERSEGRKTEAELCAEARRIVEKVDWPCEVHTLFRDQNLGCRRAVSEAITWFFEHVKEGIILEDDCVADASFFLVCAELLERYQDDERVMAISGDNYQPYGFKCDASYYFSIYPHCWGWATWRRAWQLYDGDLSAWPLLRETGWLEHLLGSHERALYRKRVVDSVYNRSVDSWAYCWSFSCFLNSGLAILPCVNLVENVGFDERATHTKVTYREAPKASCLRFPMRHVQHVQRNYDADIYTAESLGWVAKPLNITLWLRIKWKVAKLLGRL